MTKWALFISSLMLAGVVGCGDFYDGGVGSTSGAVTAAEAARDGGTNGYHCGKNLDRAYVCHTAHKKQKCVKHPEKCVPRTICISFARLQKHLDAGDTLGECPQ